MMERLGLKGEPHPMTLSSDLPIPLISLAARAGGPNRYTSLKTKGRSVRTVPPSVPATPRRVSPTEPRARPQTFPHSSASMLATQTLHANGRLYAAASRASYLCGK